MLQNFTRKLLTPRLHRSCNPIFLWDRPCIFLIHSFSPSFPGFCCSIAFHAFLTPPPLHTHSSRESKIPWSKKSGRKCDVLVFGDGAAAGCDDDENDDVILFSTFSFLCSFRFLAMFTVRVWMFVFLWCTTLSYGITAYCPLHLVKPI